MLSARVSAAESKFRCLWEAAPGNGAKLKQHREHVGIAPELPPVALLRDTGLARDIRSSDVKVSWKSRFYLCDKRIFFFFFF